MIKDMTEKQFDRKLQELIFRMKKKSFVFRNDTPEKQRIRKDKALDDYFYFKETYFPHYATKPSGKFHQDLHMYSELTECIVAIAGPRDHGKTVDLGVIKPIWKVLREDIHFPVFIGGNDDLADRRTKQIKAEYLHNPRIKHDFGELLNPFCADDEFITKDGVCYKSVGWRQYFKGLLFGPYRPDYILIDDFEDSKSINKDIAKRKLSYVRGDVYGSLPSEGGIVLWLGNNTNKDSALNYFKAEVEKDDSGNIIFCEYKAIKEDGTPLWPEGFTIKQLERMRTVMGTIDFERHMQQNPVVEGVIIKVEWFKYFEKTNYKPTGKLITLVDPSLGTKKSDYQSIITLEQVNASLYRTIRVWIRRTTISNMIRQMYEIDKALDTKIYMESNFWQVLLFDYIPPVAQEYGYTIPVFSIQTTTNKAEDIMKLQPLYERGHIEHYKPKDKDLELLEEQLCMFDPELSRSNRIRDDGPDVLARLMLRFKISAGLITGRMGDPLQSTDFRRMP